MEFMAVEPARGWGSLQGGKRDVQRRYGVWGAVAIGLAVAVAGGLLLAAGSPRGADASRTAAVPAAPVGEFAGRLLQRFASASPAEADPAAVSASSDPDRIQLAGRDTLVRPLRDLSLQAEIAARARDGTVSVAVLDLDAAALYVREADVRYELASVIKVMILLAALDAAARAGEPLAPHQQRWQREMITHSDNAAAAATLAGLGGVEALQRYLNALDLGPPRIAVHEDEWGETDVSVVDVAAFFTELALGERVPALDRALAFGLLADVLPEQRWGLSAGLQDAAPEDWRVVLKNGWVPDDDGHWHVHSAGIVTDVTGVPRYVAVVMTAGQPDLAYGVATTEAVARWLHLALAGDGEFAGDGGLPADGGLAAAY